MGYQERLGLLHHQEDQLQREHTSLGYVRLVFGIAVAILLFPPVPLILLPVIGFALAARIHQRVLAWLAETRRSIAFYEHGLARLEHHWAGLRPRTPRIDTTTSLYAADLDLFGPASLFEYLCEARTSLGEDTLASWLLRPGELAEVARRQEAVRDLRDRLALREAFAAARGPALATVDANKLADWGSHASGPLPTALGWVAPTLLALMVAAAVRYTTAHTPVALLAVLLINGVLTFTFRKSFQLQFQEAEKASRALGTVRVLFTHLETERFSSELLQELQATLLKGRPASEVVARLTRLAAWAEARSNYFVRILDLPLLYSLQFALAFQSWRRQFGDRLGPLLRVVGQVEALLSLAAYSFEHPADPFPTMTANGAQFTATKLGHPLLAEEECIRNDVSLGDETSLLLVSGSNMSGKSTLLRSVGVNAVLALAGAPVRAHALSLSPLTVAASIQVSDSLQAGRSRFYAEILRLRAITEAARQQGPVLFLIDEVLAGTNSRDRATGAQGLMKSLLGHGAIGLLSTHDLALTAIAAGQQHSMRNVHFEDEIVDGRLRFSYKLKDGVVERSNGLDLMRLIGLDV